MNAAGVTPETSLQLRRVHLGEDHGPILAQQARGAAQRLRFRPLDVDLDERIGRGSGYSSSAITRIGPRLVARPARRPGRADERPAGIQRRRSEDQRRRAAGGAHGGAFQDDAPLEPVLRDRQLQALRVRLERLEAVHRARGTDRSRHVHGEEPDVCARIDHVLPWLHGAPDELDLVQLEAAAQDVQPDGVIGQVDGKAQPWLDLLDHQVALVHLRVVAVLLLVLLRRDDVVAQVAGVLVSRASSAG